MRDGLFNLHGYIGKLEAIRGVNVMAYLDCCREVVDNKILKTQGGLQLSEAKKGEAHILYACKGSYSAAMARAP